MGTAPTPGVTGSQNRPLRNCAAVILAAGQGTRMKSALPKVLHEIGGRPMVHHVLDLASNIGARRTLVVGAGGEQVAKTVQGDFPDCEIAIQVPQLGTAHAVLAARSGLEEFAGDVFILYADTPLIRPETLYRMSEARRAGASVVVLGFEAACPDQYGRLIVDALGELQAIVEARDATPAEADITLCNSGVMAVDGRLLLQLLGQVGNDNAKREYYLTDIVALARQQGYRAAAVVCDEEEVMGVNSRSELAAAEAAFQRRLRVHWMAEGVTLRDPDSVYFNFDTVIGRDTEIGPNVVFGPGVTIGESVVIKPFCHIEGATVAPRATVGPYARLRPGTDIGEDAHIGNFVEVKKSVVESGAKINHLSYIGDAFVGAEANIGAGTITCNYDGFDKYETRIGRGAFIGSNNSLVAPVTIGDGAYTGSGGVITQDVSTDALALGRAKQVEKPGWAKAFRDRKTAGREKK